MAFYAEKRMGKRCQFLARCHKINKNCTFLFSAVMQTSFPFSYTKTEKVNGVSDYCNRK